MHLAAFVEQCPKYQVARNNDDSDGREPIKLGRADVALATVLDPRVVGSCWVGN